MTVQRLFLGHFNSQNAGQHSNYTLKLASLSVHVSYARGATTEVSFLSHTTWYPSVVPRPYQPQQASLSVSKEGLSDFCHAFVFEHFPNRIRNYDILRANKHLDLAQGLVLFMLIQPYLKSCCLPAPSLAAAISLFLSRLY